MTFTILQLNIWEGKFLDQVISYINEKRFDVVCLQEVTGGEYSKNGRNCFSELVKKTGMKGELAIYASLKNDITSYLGNATLYQSDWKQLSNHVIWMKHYKEMDTSKIHDGRQVPRCAQAMVLERSGQKVMVVNTHLMWGPTPDDAVYKRNLAIKLYRWMRHHGQDPFVLTGDFNLNPHTKIVSDFSKLGQNLTVKYRITNTLNPRIHYAQQLFPSGLPVDYIIVDKRFHVASFKIEETVDLSDHYGLVTTLRFD